MFMDAKQIFDFFSTSRSRFERYVYSQSMNVNEPFDLMSKIDFDLQTQSSILGTKPCLSVNPNQFTKER